MAERIYKLVSTLPKICQECALFKRIEYDVSRKMEAVSGTGSVLSVSVACVVYPNLQRNDANLVGLASTDKTYFDNFWKANITHGPVGTGIIAGTAPDFCPQTQEEQK